MFVDASAIVAILAREADADDLSDIVDGAAAAITSPIAVFEAAAAICRKRRCTVEQARDEVRRFTEMADIRVAPISAADADEALSAYSRYGKGRGHAAQLNLGDCFAYAMAKLHGMPLLFKGDDFSKTDVVSACTA